MCVYYIHRDSRLEEARTLTHHFTSHHTHSKHQKTLKSIIGSTLRNSMTKKFFLQFLLCQIVWTVCECAYLRSYNSKNIQWHDIIWKPQNETFHPYTNTVYHLLVCVCLRPGILVIDLMYENVHFQREQNSNNSNANCRLWTKSECKSILCMQQQQVNFMHFDRRSHNRVYFRVFISFFFED